MKYQVFIVSYKRAGFVSSDAVFKNAKIVIPESQLEEYKKFQYENGCELLTIPDEFDGNIARKRNYILDNFSDMGEGNILMVDDDYKYLGMVQNLKHFRLDIEAVDEFLQNGFQMCKDIETVMWGVNVSDDPRFYSAFSPFSTLTMCLGPFQAFCNNPLRYDEKLSLKEDYDMCLQVLYKYHKILRFNKYHYKVNHLDLPGGVVSYRTINKEIEQLNILQNKWGKDVVKFNLDKDIDPVIKVPLKGI